MKKHIFLLFFIVLGTSLFAQYEEQKITTGVPFLTITPDGRGGAMGDIGAATSSDITSIFYNPAKYSFSEKKSGIQISYSPWLHKIASGMSINYLAGFYKINDQQAFSASLKYFRIGEIIFTDEFGQVLTPFTPNEFALTTAYSMKLTETFSGSISIKAIYSNLTGNINTTSTHPGFAAAGDLSFYFNKPIEIKNNDAIISWGINFSNLGTKISYGTFVSPFIPANLRTGVGLKYYIDEFNTIEFGIDLNKLLVPTPPIFKTDENGNLIPLPGGGYEIEAGLDPNVDVTTGIIHSFYDAPNGLSEEIHEIMFGTGVEYAYNSILFVRGGLFYESPEKGGRRYVTTGIGFKFNVFNIDFSYLIPVYSHSPLESTLRFTLSFYFDKNKN